MVKTGLLVMSMFSCNLAVATPDKEVLDTFATTQSESYMTGPRCTPFPECL